MIRLAERQKLLAENMFAKAGNEEKLNHFSGNQVSLCSLYTAEMNHPFRFAAASNPIAHDKAYMDFMGYVFV